MAAMLPRVFLLSILNNCTFLFHSRTCIDIMIKVLFGGSLRVGMSDSEFADVATAWHDQMSLFEVPFALGSEVHNTIYSLGGRIDENVAAESRYGGIVDERQRIDRLQGRHALVGLNRRWGRFSSGIDSFRWWRRFS